MPTITPAMFNALTAATDRQLHHTTDTGEWRNNSGVVFDPDACAALIEGRYITRGPLSTVPTPAGWAGAHRYVPTVKGTHTRVTYRPTA